MKNTLNPTVPAIPPAVLAAYTEPTSLPASLSRPRRAAIASGKLAPHKQAAGRRASADRTVSNSKFNHGFSVRVGSMGQKGRTLLTMYAAHAIAAASNI